VPFVAEIVGPAGSGKSSLMRALAHADRMFLPIAGYRTPRGAPLYLSSAAAVMPIVPRRPARAVARRQARWMIRLEASERVLRHRSVPGTVVLFDQGPVYTLARLTRVHAPGTCSRAYQQWRSKKVRQWADILRVLIVLDAPDDVLLARVRERSKAHYLDQLDDASARDALRAERAACAAVVAELTSAGRLRTIRIDTSGRSADELASLVVAMLGDLGRRAGPARSEPRAESTT
jgi:hypothetical protein